MRVFKRFVRKIRSWCKKNPDRFLEELNGVIHVGANVGQERDLYKRYNLDVIWIEPIPEVYDVLKNNLEGHDRQIAYQYLVTDKDDEQYNFNVADNNGLSSSIFDFKHHKDIWPGVGFERTISLKSITLPAFLKKEKINIDKYDALIMDTQGAELLVLQGAEEILGHFKYIKAEVSDFEAYKDCCQIDDLQKYLFRLGFREHARDLFATRRGSGNYYDIWYRKIV